MNRDYAEGRIQDALKSTGGNAAKARQQIISWAIADAKLLQELVAPHLTGIVAHAVGRSMIRKDKPVPIPPAALASAPANINAAGKGDPFGLEILKAIALGNPAQFGQENGVSPRRQAASQTHIDAIRQMTSKDKPAR